jgi:hypothetical protein
MVPVIRAPSALTGAAVVAFAGIASLILCKYGCGDRQGQYRARQYRGVFQPSFHEIVPSTAPRDASAVRAGLYSSLTYLTFSMVERNVVKGELRATVGLDQAGLKSYIDSDNQILSTFSRRNQTERRW